MQTERSLAELTSTLGTQISELFRNEVRLAAAETMEATAKFKAAAINIGAAIVLGSAALTMLLMALAYLLALVLPIWIAMLISSALGALAAYVLAHRGLKAISTNWPIFAHTSRQIASDASLLKEKIT